MDGMDTNPVVLRTLATRTLVDEGGVRSEGKVLKIFFWNLYLTRWWFQTFLIFTPSWGRFPI